MIQNASIVLRPFRQLMVGSRGRVLTLALPAVGEQVLNMMVGMVNTYMVGHLGSTALTAVGLSDQVVMLVSAFFMAVATGSTAFVARFTGAGDSDRASEVLQQSVLLGLGIGLLFTFAGFSLAGQAMVWLQAAEAVIPLGTTYLKIVSLSYILMALMFVGNGALRGAGDTRTPLGIMGIVNVINILVSYVFLKGWGPFPELGIIGPAIGASVGRSVGSFLVIGLLIRGQARLKLHLSRLFQLDWDLIKRVMNVGLPTGAEQVIMRLGQVAFAAVVASLGTAAYAAHQISMTSSSMSFMPGFGFGVAATTLVGQQLGARKPQMAEEACQTACHIAIYFMGTIGLLLFLCAPQVVAVFIGEADVIQLGTTCVRILGFIQPATAATLVLAGGLRGAGDTRWPMVITAISTWLIRIPLGRLLAVSWGLGLAGVWIAIALDMWGRALLFWWRFRTGRWKTVRV